VPRRTALGAIGALCLLANSRRRAAAAEIEGLRAELAQERLGRREVEQLKDDLITCVSHELKTPLTSVIGYAELLEDAGLDEEQRHFLKALKRNSKRLNCVISDIVTAANIADRAAYTQLAPAHATAIVEEAASALSPRIEGKGLELSLDLADVGECLLDADRLAQIVDNLVSNALKFTDQGQIAVTLHRQGQWLVLAVTDSGTGIATTEQPYVFERFSRTNQALADAVPGLGLGLYITRAIVESQGGRVDLESELGVGTTVCVRLPFLLTS
jgi:two-component system phosphate regulon sensor histidine kinase PhoR